jgi:Rrf2 family protein
MPRKGFVMQVSQKCQYALRALFELAKRQDVEAVSVSEIADAQAIPQRFLEVIFQDLRDEGLVGSRRGNRGGYFLATPPDSVRVGDLIRLFDGSLSPVTCLAGRSEEHCRLKNRCVFQNLWRKAQEAIEGVYDQTTLQDLIDDERTAAGRHNLLVQVG